MLTGDAKETAVAIARQIRLLPAHSNHEAQQVERSQSVKAPVSPMNVYVRSRIYVCLLEACVSTPLETLVVIFLFYDKTVSAHTAFCKQNKDIK